MQTQSQNQLKSRRTVVIETIEDTNVLKVQPLDKFGTPVEIIRLFGSPEKYRTAVKEFESALYSLVK